MKKNKWLLIIIVVSIILTFGLSYAFRVTLNSYTDNNFKVEYDSTWKVVNDTNELKLKHKKTNSILHIQCKELDKTYMDISLNDLIVDVIDSIEKQNIDYKLINRMSNPTDMYESFSYLYEKDMKQALVNIYKKDNKLIVVYYEADSECYDIVLDSVDSILRTLKIYTGKKVN